MNDEPISLPDGQRVQGKAIFRHDRSENRGTLKIVSDFANLLYQRLTDPVEEPRCHNHLRLFDRCKRMGVSCVASMQNILHPYVVEFRFAPTGGILSLTEEYELDNALAFNRHQGSAVFDGRFLTIQGDAATALRDFVRAGRMVSSQPLPAHAGPIVLRLEDLASGNWDVEPF